MAGSVQPTVKDRQQLMWQVLDDTGRTFLELLGASKDHVDHVDHSTRGLLRSQPPTESGAHRVWSTPKRTTSIPRNRVMARHGFEAIAIRLEATAMK